LVQTIAAAMTIGWLAAVVSAGVGAKA
jgi:hypothetical protein